MKRRRRQTEEDLEYLEKRPKSVQRRKANPELRLADLLERIINTISATHEVLHVTPSNYHSVLVNVDGLFCCGFLQVSTAAFFSGCCVLLRSGLKTLNTFDTILR